MCFYFSFTWNKKPPLTCQHDSRLLMWRAWCRRRGSSPPQGLPHGPTPTYCLPETSWSWCPVCDEVGSTAFEGSLSSISRNQDNQQLGGPVLCHILKTIWLSLHWPNGYEREYCLLTSPRAAWCKVGISCRKLLPNCHRGVCSRNGTGPESMSAGKWTPRLHGKMRATCWGSQWDPAQARCCAEGHGSLRTIGDRWTVGLDDLVGLFQPWWCHDSMNPATESFSSSAGTAVSFSLVTSVPNPTLTPFFRRLPQHSKPIWFSFSFQKLTHVTLPIIFLESWCWQLCVCQTRRSWHLHQSIPSILGQLFAHTRGISLFPLSRQA